MEIHREEDTEGSGTVISQKLRDRKMSNLFHRHLLGYSIR